MDTRERLNKLVREIPVPQQPARRDEDEDVKEKIPKAAAKMKQEIAQDNAKSRDKLRQEKIRRNMADSKYLNKVAAIGMQNSMLKPRGKDHQGLVLSRQNQLSMSNDAAGKMEGEGALSSLLQGPGAPKGGGGGGDGFLKKLGRKVDNAQMERLKGAEKLGKLGRKMEDAQVDSRNGNGRSDDVMEPGRREPQVPAIGGGRGENRLSQIAVLGGFDAESYLNGQKMVQGDGGDSMKKFQFNQVASDATPPDRFLKDYRNPL